MKAETRVLSYGRQVVDEDDIQAVVDVLKSEWFTTGPKVGEFETALAQYCGARHAIAVANGTAALHVAMLAAGIGPGNRVLTSAITFLASANCAEFVGATADFADIDPRTCNVNADTFRAGWRKDVRAVIPVDFAGQPCDMPAIAALARERGALIIEDASHAIGSRFQHEGQWHKVGGHPWADMTTFSFHPVKTITTGEGGAILTNDDRLAERCRMFRSHGMKRPLEGGTLESGSWPLNTEIGPWFYEMSEVGYNYRLTDIQCALGLSQLKKLDGFVKRRQEIVDRYNQAFRGMSHVTTPGFLLSDQDLCSSPAWHLYVIQIDFAALGRTRTQVMNELKSLGIGTQVHYIPVHLQPYYQNKYGYAPGKCPVAEQYYTRALSLPLYPAMKDADTDRVVEGVQSVGT